MRVLLLFKTGGINGGIINSEKDCGPFAIEKPSETIWNLPNPHGFAFILTNGGKSAMKYQICKGFAQFMGQDEKEGDNYW